MSSRDFVNIMLNPFEDVTSRKLLIFGSLGFLLLSILGFFFHFINNGIIQLHFIDPRPFWKYLIYGLINTGALTALMYAYARFNYSKTRLLDVLISVLIAQCVLVVIALFLLNPYIMGIMDDLKGEIEKGNIDKLNISPINLGIITLAGIFSIFSIYYFFHLLVRGMKIAINSNKLFHTIAIVLLTLVLDVILNVLNPYF
ncbi:hypothetical protein [Sphingobacterium sp.]|uniref:hypothetical protein n=1 Tax=Sphingobacterium sp. TaxID=341027 RepID=UPI0028AE972C|nr:hypothetical protein [Sphingobacterium sp.]